MDTFGLWLLRCLLKNQHQVAEVRVYRSLTVAARKRLVLEEFVTPISASKHWPPSPASCNDVFHSLSSKREVWN
jgi:hypothetical protein